MTPDGVLYSQNQFLPPIACCDHYAGNEKFIVKAFQLQKELGPVFDITCDLEDGAQAGSEKQQAELVASLIQSESNSYNMAGFRIHDFEHPHWKDDLKIVLSVAGDRVSHITIPKTQNLRDLEEMIAYANQLCDNYNISTIRIHVLIETHSALQQAFDIAALPQVCSLEFGLMDFVSEHLGAIPASCMESPGQFENALIRRAKAQIAAAAAAYHKIASHNVTTNFLDSSQVSADARRARLEFGFLRMWSIHPSQIKPIVEALSPANEEIEYASRLLLEAQNAGWGPIRFDQRLHDRASYRYYWELLKRAKRANQTLPASVMHWFCASQS